VAGIGAKRRQIKPFGAKSFGAADHGSYIERRTDILKINRQSRKGLPPGRVQAAPGIQKIPIRRGLACLSQQDMADLIDKPAEFPGGKIGASATAMIRAGFEKLMGLLKYPKDCGRKKTVRHKQFQQFRKIAGIISARLEAQLRSGKDPAEFPQPRNAGKFFQFVPGYHGKIFMPCAHPVSGKP
jgi:hypothetical protein